MPIASELVLRLHAHPGPSMIGFCLGLQGLVHNVQITLRSYVQVFGKQFPRQFLLSPPPLPGASLRAVMCDTDLGMSTPQSLTLHWRASVN